MRRLLATALALGSCAWVTAQTPAPNADTVARALQQRYQTITDFSADFVHTYRGGMLRTKTSERGTVKIKKPGKMRWEYTSPEKKTFVSDGVQIYSYVPADKQGIHSPVPKDDEATTAMLFLAGKGNLLRDFEVSYVDAPSADTVALRLDPRKKQRDYDWLIVAVDKNSMQIRQLTAADQQGGRSTFQFSNYRENTGLTDSVFTFKFPRGTDVIAAGSIR